MIDAGTLRSLTANTAASRSATKASINPNISDLLGFVEDEYPICIMCEGGQERYKNNHSYHTTKTPRCGDRIKRDGAVISSVSFVLQGRLFARKKR